MPPYFDRFDICEAYAVYAWDYGNYVLWSRLQRMGFRPRPGLGNYTHLTPNGYAIYASLCTRTGTDEPF
jgi:hypothetical protein